MITGRATLDQQSCCSSWEPVGGGGTIPGGAGTAI